MHDLRSPLRRLAHSAGSLAMLNLASMALAFFIGVLLARRLGPAEYGIYGLAMTIATLAGLITELGLPVLTMREVAAAQATGRWSLARGLEIWADRAVLGLSALLLTGFFMVNYTTGLSGASTLGATMLWAIILVPVVALGKLRGLALLSLGHTMAGQLPVLVLRPALFVLALLAAWWLLPDLSPSLAMALQVGASFAAMVVVRLAWRLLRPTEISNAAPQFARRSWLAACLPMGMTEGLRLLEGQSAVLMLGLLTSLSDVGIYRVADAVAAATTVGQSILATAATPIFANLHAAKDRPGLQRVIGATAIGMTLSTILLGLPFLLFGNRLLSLIFGVEFAPALLPFLLIWGGLLISAMFGPLQSYANMTERQQLTTINFLISVLVFIAVAAVAIPHLGAVGAGLGVVAANLVSNAWLWRQIWLRDRINASIFHRQPWSIFRLEEIKCLLKTRASQKNENSV